MKVTVILLLVTCLQLSAKTSAQVTLSKKKAPLEQVLKSIHQQSGYTLFYDEALLKQKGQPVDIIINDASVERALNLVFRQQILTYEITGNTILVKEKAAELLAVTPPPPITITGKVTNVKGEPLAGATVAIKGSAKGIITDAEGYYKLQLTANEKILVFSFIGMKKQEVEVQGRTIINIVMQEDVSLLREVAIVSTAYGIEKRTKELGYSVTKVSGEEINRANSGNLLSGLVGKVSGMNLTTQSSDMTPQMRILLRGIRSFGENSNNQPLFIFNGSPLSFGSDQTAAQRTMDFINNINPADIEDVTVLKGANGTAMYGSEGVNGVIIITTKKGVKGKAVINFKNNTSFQLIDYRKDHMQREYGIGEGIDQSGNGIYSPTSLYLWGPHYDGRMVAIGYPDEKGEMQMVPYSANKDARRFWNVAKTVRNNLSISQSDDNSSLYLGLGNTAQKGLLPGDNQSQSTFLLSTGRRMGKLKMQINVNYTYTKDDRGPNQDGIKIMPAFIPLLSYKDYNNSYWGNHDRYWNGISPYEEIATNRTKSTTNAVSGSLSLTLNPFRGIIITERPSLNYSGSYSKNKTAPIYYSDYAHTVPNKSYDRTPAVGENMQSTMSINNDFLLSTIHETGNFAIKTNIGNTIRENYVKNLKSGAALMVPVYNLAYAISPTPAVEAEQLSRVYSLFGNTSIGYKDRVFLELTARNEWDSKRAKVARGKDLYLGANTSVVLNQVIPSMKDIKWLSTVRLRASLAHSANMNILPYQFERILGLSDNFVTPDYQYLLGYSFFDSNTPNPFIKPEKVISQEYGGVFGFLDDRITLDIAYYYQRNNSVILNVENTWLSGAPSIDNAGKFQNNGMDATLKIDPLFKLPNGMSLTVEGRFAINNNKVLSLTDVYNGLFPALDPSGETYYARTGRSAFEFAVRDWQRDPQGRIIVDRNTGMPLDVNYNSYVLKGKTLPTYLASVNLNFSWKKLSVSVLADYSGGNQHRFDTWNSFYMGKHPLTTFNNRQPYVIPNSSYDDGTGNFVKNTDVFVANAGQELYAKFANVSNYGLVDAAFLKIREVSIQYEIPMKTKTIKSLICTIYGRDLFSFYPKSNIYGDPGLIRGPGQREFNPNAASNDSGVSGSNLAGGFSDATSLPGTVSYGFTIALTF